jgi:ATP-dependent protease HslVU (ClpYQ) peptidase subunit
MKVSRKVLIASCVLVLAGFSNIQAQEKKIKRSELPSAVEKTVVEQSKGATVRGFSTEVEKGQRVYEVEMVVNGHTKDLLVDENGNVLEVEEEVAMGLLPPEVRSGIKKAAGAGTIGKIESLIKGGNLVAYEAVVKSGKKRSEIQVGPDGKKLTHAQ